MHMWGEETRMEIKELWHGTKGADPNAKNLKADSNKSETVFIANFLQR